MYSGGELSVGKVSPADISKIRAAYKLGEDVPNHIIESAIISAQKASEELKRLTGSSNTRIVPGVLGSSSGYKQALSEAKGGIKPEEILIRGSLIQELGRNQMYEAAACLWIPILRDVMSLMNVK